MRSYVNVHLDKGDEVSGGRTNRSWDGGPVLTQVVIRGDERLEDLRLVGSPRVLRRIAQELLDAADVACRREDAMTDPVLPFEAVQ